MRTWTATTTTAAGPEAVLDVLTDPDAAARWAPVPFDVDDLDGERLLAGSRARVSGRLAGRRVGFDVEVHEADENGLALQRERSRRLRRRLPRWRPLTAGAARCAPPCPSAPAAASPGACSPRRRAPCSPPAPCRPPSARIAREASFAT